MCLWHVDNVRNSCQVPLHERGSLSPPVEYEAALAPASVVETFPGTDKVSDSP